MVAHLAFLSVALLSNAVVESFLFPAGPAARIGNVPKSQFSTPSTAFASSTTTGGTTINESTQTTPPPSPSSSSSASNQSNQSNHEPIKESYDAIIVGSGLGGLSCAALLSHYGYSVAVFESHYAPGGAAHGYSVRVPSSKLNYGASESGDSESSGGDGSGDGSGSSETYGTFVFDTGPSFFSGLNPNYPAKSSNPLRTLLDLIGEEVECVPYTTFGLHFPEGEFIHSSNFGRSGGVLDQLDKESRNEMSAMDQWDQLMKAMEPLAQAVDAMPTLALRSDIGVALTAGMYLPNFAKTNPLENLKLTSPFQRVIENSGVKNEFVKNWLDLLCFCLSGVPSEGTITAEMAMMMGEFYDEGAIMDCPVGGAKSIVDALVRGIEKKGGRVFCNSHVEEICIEDRRAVGVRLKNKKSESGASVVRAKKGVVSNLSIWDLMNSGIVDTNHFPENFVEEKKETPLCPSFMHLHVGFQMTKEELSKLQAHYIYMEDWSRGVIDEENCALVSIPSVHDDSLAPDNHAVLHIYTPATERFERWQTLSRNSPEYNSLKEERSAFLWKVLEKIIPDIRQRTVHYQVGTPLTHQRFLRRYRGTYGPAIYASDGSFPFPGTPVSGLLVCGDSCFPGIGVPAVAGSGMIAANSVSLELVGAQMKALREVNSR